MRYLEADARHQDPSLVYLPARAASIAMALSSIASFVAVVFLTRLTVEAPLETGHIVVVGFTAAAFLVFVCTGLVIAYARFLPPATTRIWGLVHFVVPYLALLWAVCFALSGAVLGEVLLPLMSCTRPYPTLCLTWLRHRALQTVAVASVALAASLALCILVSLDLHSTHPEASVVILRYELAEQRARQAQARGVRAMQAALEAPLLGDESDGVDEGPSGYPPSWAKGRRATVRAYAARARLPVDDPEAAWPAFVAAQPSSGPRTHPKRKHHQHRSSSETGEEADERRRRHKREKKRRQAKLDADANTGNVVTTRMEAASGGGTDAA
ncbi:hypothetical protein DMC30DRAFT_416123 [Rhodotorula diobovata]|uniref:Uncharacterized protein n=1 Tax=Rhodotorula diobovata TaxID=5288 RepID=A0A5C5FWR0_9BASI|nr:hypothetical protein DMC30DRAFT_416123 [Rhodotorula diobovata]